MDKTVLLFASTSEPSKAMIYEIQKFYKIEDKVIDTVCITDFLFRICFSILNLLALSIHRKTDDFSLGGRTVLCANVTERKRLQSR